MSTETRQAFHLANQKEKDILAAVKNITPVISVIREWGKTEQEYDLALIEKDKVLKEIMSIEHVLEISFSGSEIKEPLSKELEKKKENVQKLSTKTQRLKKICDYFELEVMEYQSYARLFSWWIDEKICEKVVKSLSSKEENLAIVFLVLNSGTNGSYLSVYNELENSGTYCECIIKGWNYMLRQLKDNSI